MCGSTRSRSHDDGRRRARVGDPDLSGGARARRRRRRGMTLPERWRKGRRDGGRTRALKLAVRHFTKWSVRTRPELAEAVSGSGTQCNGAVPA
ncbi:MAG: hypothetical protein HGA87_04600 [Desulfobulbaceae bacterium]|nr:hypothetical protein [Desulfobulbaceae bacterium]